MMQKLVAGLFAQLSPGVLHHNASRDELDEIIDRLRRQQSELEARLSTMSDGVEKRRTRIALEVAHLQQRKALELRTNLP